MGTLRYGGYIKKRSEDVMKDYDVKDISLCPIGRERVAWAAKFMPVLKAIREEFKDKKPLKGIKISACLHVTTETANLIMTLKEGGASIRLCASNPLSTQDDVAAMLVEDLGINVFAKRGVSHEEYYNHIEGALKIPPDITIDDGADLVSTLHSKKENILHSILGGTEETTTGVIRLKNLEKEGKLAYPIIAVNESRTKYMFDNRYGTGQSTIDGILRATNFLFAGATVVVVGYGWCGKGIAMKAKGLGAEVIVCEVDPIKALEARMDGYKVMKMSEASQIGDLFITSTGCINVITKEHFLKMKDGAILANAGHFNVEIDGKSLDALSKSKREIRKDVVEYEIGDKKIYLLAEGRLVNLAAAEGHPAMVMDMSFANQALACEYLTKNTLSKKVHKLPEEIDYKIAKLKLKTMGISIDELTKAQKEYLASWETGT